jgi:hypothetical protein
MANNKEPDTTTKSGKPKLHSKPLADLQALANTVRSKNLTIPNKAIQKKVGRGR